jgi:hypothetical protein
LSRGPPRWPVKRSLRCRPGCGTRSSGRVPSRRASRKGRVAAGGYGRGATAGWRGRPSDGQDRAAGVRGRCHAPRRFPYGRRGARFGEPAHFVGGCQRRVPAEEHHLALAGGPLQAGRAGDSPCMCRQASLAAVTRAPDVPGAACGESLIMRWLHRGVPGSLRRVGLQGRSPTGAGRARWRGAPPLDPDTVGCYPASHADPRRPTPAAAVTFRRAGRRPWRPGHDCKLSGCRPHTCRPLKAATIRQADPQHPVGCLRCCPRWEWVDGNPAESTRPLLLRRRNNSRRRPRTWPR